MSEVSVLLLLDSGQSKYGEKNMRESCGVSFYSAKAFSTVFVKLQHMVNQSWVDKSHKAIQ